MKDEPCLKPPSSVDQTHGNKAEQAFTYCRKQTADAHEDDSCSGTKFSDVSLERIRAAQSAFAQERDWAQYHTPRNLILALMGEVGELAEIFQWRGEVGAGLPGFSQSDRQHVGEELSDVLLYLIRLSDVCGVDLGEAVMAKIQKNAAKYPADVCRGSAAKYTHLHRPPSTQTLDTTTTTDTTTLDTANAANTAAAPPALPAGEQL